jgi:hypothetical protein
MFLEELLNEKSFLAIRFDQQNKEKATRLIQSTCQSSSRPKKDQIKKILALIKKIQIQDSGSLDEKLDTVTPTKQQWYTNQHK